MLKLTKAEAQDKVSLVLTKRNIPNPPKSSVKAFFDTTGSFKDEWDDGIVALLADRVLAVASRLDDDGILDVYHFNKKAHPLGPCDFNQIQDSDAHLKQMLRDSKTPLWGATYFAPIATQVVNDLYVADGGSQSSNAAAPTQKKRGFFSSLFGGDEAEKTPASVGVPASYRNTKPTLVYVLTDGDAYDPEETMAAFKALQQQAVYIMFVNVSEQSKVARDLADKLDNVGYVFYKNLSKINDEDLMNSLLTDEFVKWRAQFPA